MTESVAVLSFLTNMNQPTPKPPEPVVRCKACEGTGRSSKGWYCLPCGGTGRIKVKQ